MYLNVFKQQKYVHQNLSQPNQLPANIVDSNQNVKTWEVSKVPVCEMVYCTQVNKYYNNFNQLNLGTKLIKNDEIDPFGNNNKNTNTVMNTSITFNYSKWIGSNNWDLLITIVSHSTMLPKPHIFFVYRPTIICSIMNNSRHVAVVINPL